MPALSICNLNAARGSGIRDANAGPGVRAIKSYLHRVSIWFDSVYLCGLIVRSSEDDFTHIVMQENSDYNEKIIGSLLNTLPILLVTCHLFKLYIALSTLILHE